ncbi:hypothetical protein I8748_26460 [Nostoc sp. CENA67]|uniref:Uncharacterized protein n=1 Tax=Amazonocrinis nigriterrae CENA67 TaxID=2794033 RepID=A0A8J7I0C0_9NOST|nr:hypothetical protein [Amazonocrinis nigriterrae]MBH8565674.1 hypothetical protein [Amazonocrinis nigriterrae CENA67]
MRTTIKPCLHSYSIPNAAPQLDLNGSDEAGIDFATTFYRGTLALELRLPPKKIPLLTSLPAVSYVDIQM